MGAKVVESSRGRARQMNTGVQAATGEAAAGRDSSDVAADAGTP